MVSILESKNSAICVTLVDSSNLTRESKYFLSDYTTSEKQIIVVKGEQYEITRFQGDHSNEFLVSEMQDGEIDGRCQLFSHGILSLAWEVRNGKRVGEVTEYENGRALRRESWNSFFGNGERRVTENAKGGLIMTIRYGCTEENEEIVIYRGEFGENMNRQGYGIEYDRKSGREKIEGYWAKDQLIGIIREFDVEKNIMIEYAEDLNNVDPLFRIPVYMGEYCIDNGAFVRNGIGYLIDEKSGTAIRESEWDHGKEKEGGIELYDGWYVNGMRESIRCVLKNEKPRKLETLPKISDIPEEQMVIRNSDDLFDISLGVTRLVISSNCGNELTELDLSKFESLRSIEIGNECFQSVQTFSINGLHRLKSVKIESNSFTKDHNSYSKNESKSFHLLNCESLESIEIGEFSFSDFAGDFELKNLESLESIIIGKMDRESYNFWYGSFTIHRIAISLNNE